MENDISLRVLTPDGGTWEEQPKWRHDFPIDIPEDNFVARRDFTKFMVLTSFAFVFGQFWIGLISKWRRRRFDSQRIVAIAELPVGGAKLFNYPGPNDPCILIRASELSFLAFDSRCTHLSCAVLPDVSAGIFRCPCHHGVFDLTSGRPLAGPPRRPLPRVNLETRDGAIYAIGVEERTT